MPTVVKKVNSRSWISPVTAVCFVVLSVSGVPMMLHFRIPGLHVLHEFVGILFIIAGTYHIVLNWRTLLGHLQSRHGILATAVMAILGTLLLIGGIGHEQGEHHGPHGHGGPSAQAEE